jgi:hypothetical protein
VPPEGQRVIGAICWTALGLAALWPLGWELSVWRYQRRKRLGHPAEEAAVSRALETLTFHPRGDDR